MLGTGCQFLKGTFLTRNFKINMVCFLQLSIKMLILDKFIK
jgi:hypothetical protein